MPEVRATLELDASSAEAAIESLGSSLESALDSAVSSLESSLAEAFGGVTGGEITITADTSAAEADISALADVPSVDVPVSADTGEAVSAIDALPAEATPVDIPVTADTSDAQDAIDELTADTGDLGVSLTGAGDAGSAAAGGINETASAAGTAGSLSAAATGDINAFASGIGSVGGVSSAAVAGVAGLGGAVGFLFSQGVTASSAIERMSTVTRGFKNDVDNVNVGDLDTSLSSLGKQLGETTSGMQSAATNAFQFATASGVAGPKAAEFSNEIVALASRAVALNPALGNVEEVAGTLTTKFAAGRGALGAYGIDLQKADINALALAETGKTLASELTKGEKAIATADLATQKYGNNIKDSVENASKNATIQVRQLKAAFEDAAGQIGAPLVSPMVETLKALIPIGVEAGRIVGQLAQVSLPLLTSAATAIAPTLGAVSSILGAIPEPIQQVAIAAGAGAFAWSRFGEAITNVPGTLRVLSTVVPPLVNSLGGLSGVAAIAAPVIAAIAVSAGAAALGYVTWKNSTADIDNAITELDSAVTAKHIPAITTAVSAVQKATQSHHDNSVALKDELDATNQAVTGTTQLGGSVEVYNNTAKNAEVFQKAFNTALKEGPATALVALGAFQQAGVATAFMGAQLDVAAHQAKNLQQAQAQVQAATAPLSTTFQQAATAAGGQTTAMFQAVGAVSAMADADVKVEAAQQQFNKAIETGDPIQVRAAASAQAGAVAQAAYADAIAHGVPPIQAGKDATAAFGAELQRLADAQPAGKLKDQLQDLSNTVQALPKTATVDVSAVTHGGEQVDSLKAKITALEPKTVQAIADAIGEPDVESLKTTIAGLTPKQVDAVARALGRGDVDALTAAVNGLTPKQVQAVADAIGKGDVDALKASVAGMTPKQVDAVARALGISDVNALKAAIAGVTGKTVTIQVLTAGVEAAKNILHSVGAASGGHIGAYASGGNVGTVGQPIVVGELGPELFVPDTPGTVVPHDKTRTILASSGGATPNVLSVNIDARGATREAVDRLKDIDWSKLKKLIDTPGPGMSNAFLGGRR